MGDSMAIIFQRITGCNETQEMKKTGLHVKTLPNQQRGEAPPGQQQ